MYIKLSNFSTVRKLHEIHKNLNPMKINNHTAQYWVNYELTELSTGNN